MISQISCGAPGTCAAAGYAYVHITPKLLLPEAFVINQAGGSWTPARIVPGIIKLDKDGGSFSLVIACASAPASRCITGGAFQIAGVSEPRRHLPSYPFLAAEK
jgi:hypothetical protein